MERVWIYQANRFFKKDELPSIEADLNSFIANWKTHGVPLLARAEILEDLFLVLYVDEGRVVASGCSVDSSVHFLKSLGEKYAVDFFDRLNVAYRSEDGKVHLATRSEFEGLLKAGVLDQDTIVFNNLITSSKELANKWQVPLRDSWHSKVF